MPTDRQTRIAAVEGVIASLYELAARQAPGGLRQASVDGQLQTFRTHDEVLTAIRKWEQQLRWLKRPGGRRFAVRPFGDPGPRTDPQGGRGGQ